jgi:hypothetical protein
MTEATEVISEASVGREREKVQRTLVYLVSEPRFETGTH